MREFEITEYFTSFTKTIVKADNPEEAHEIFLNRLKSITRYIDSETIENLQPHEEYNDKIEEIIDGIRVEPLEFKQEKIQNEKFWRQN